jgi:hypothetical protein
MRSQILEALVVAVKHFAMLLQFDFRQSWIVDFSSVLHVPHISLQELSNLMELRFSDGVSADWLSSMLAE